MVTFDEARELVRALEEPTWPGPGTYLVADWGREDVTHFHVITGAREDLIEHDPAHRPVEAPVWFVDRVTGAVDCASYLPGGLTAAKLEAMTVVSGTGLEVHPAA